MKQNNPSSIPMDGASVETAAKARWENDPELRAEFGDSLESWLGYSKAKAKGLVKFAGHRASIPIPRDE